MSHLARGEVSAPDTTSRAAERISTMAAAVQRASTSVARQRRAATRIVASMSCTLAMRSAHTTRLATTSSCALSTAGGAWSARRCGRRRAGRSRRAGPGRGPPRGLHAARRVRCPLATLGPDVVEQGPVDWSAVGPRAINGSRLIDSLLAADVHAVHSPSHSSTRMARSWARLDEVCDRLLHCRRGAEPTEGALHGCVPCGPTRVEVLDLVVRTHSVALCCDLQEQSWQRSLRSVSD